MMYEISLSGKNLMVFIPTDSKDFSIPTPVGVMGIQDIQKQIQKQSGTVQDAAQKRARKPAQTHTDGEK